MRNSNIKNSKIVIECHGLVGIFIVTIICVLVWMTRGKTEIICNAINICLKSRS